MNESELELIQVNVFMLFSFPTGQKFKRKID